MISIILLSVMIPVLLTPRVLQVEYQMKKLEQSNVVKRCGIREWVKL